MDFIPYRDGDLNTYETTFAAKYPEIAAQLGIAAENATATVAIITDHLTSYSAMNEKKAEGRAAVKTNASAKSKSVAEMRRVSQLLKSTNGYTEAIGRELGIIGSPNPAIDLENIKPTLTSKLVGNNLIISFDKQRMGGINIFSKRSGETDFQFLATDTVSPYEDNRPKLNPAMPEERQFYAFYFLDDGQVGQQSDIITVRVP